MLGRIEDVAITMDIRMRKTPILFHFFSGPICTDETGGWSPPNGILQLRKERLPTCTNKSPFEIRSKSKPNSKDAAVDHGWQKITAQKTSNSYLETSDPEWSLIFHLLVRRLYSTSQDVAIVGIGKLLFVPLACTLHRRDMGHRTLMMSTHARAQPSELSNLQMRTRDHPAARAKTAESLQKMQLSQQFWNHGPAH